MPTVIQSIYCRELWVIRVAASSGQDPSPADHWVGTLRLAETHGLKLIN